MLSNVWKVSLKCSRLWVFLSSSLVAIFFAFSNDFMVFNHVKTVFKIHTLYTGGRKSLLQLDVFLVKYHGSDRTEYMQCGETISSK